MRRVAVIAVIVGIALCPLLGLAKDENKYVDMANQAVEQAIQIATDRILAADTYAQMEFWASWADAQMNCILDWLEGKIGPVEYEEFEVALYNEKVGETVTFDPIHVIGG